MICDVMIAYKPKPCPFCGSNDIRWKTMCSGHGEVDDVLYCSKCYATITSSGNKQDIIEKWNRRTDEKLSKDC